MKERRRCWWAGDDPLYVAYHDEEWGRPVHDDRRFFEMLTLEGAQAGLSWITILRKREAYRRAFLAVQEEFGGFDRYVWRFTGGRTLARRPKTREDVPARTAESDALSKDLLKRGFRFAGSTICYAFLQACGLVDDHVADCFRALR